MLELLIRKNSPKNILEELDINDIFSKLKELYGYWDIEEDRKRYLTSVIKNYGYLLYPHYQVLDELTEGEIIFALEQKFINEGVYDGEKFIKIKNPSALARGNVKNSNWFKREGHNIKLVSLSALADGEKTKDTGKFIQWLAQVITLPCGNKKEGVLPSTLYLIPFHPREFECAYLPQSSEISPKLEDEKLKKFLGLDVQTQVKLFIALTQLSGHPVIYDILPQTGRFSKIVLSKPYVARWFDINELTNSIERFVEIVVKNLRATKDYTKDDIQKTKEVYIAILKGSKKKYTQKQKKIVDKIEEDLKEYKILASYKMSFKAKQDEILEKVEKIIETVNCTKPKEEKDIKNQKEIVCALIQEGLWPAPGGAWCSAGVPIFDKMHQSKEYPMFKHYNFKSEDVTHFANLDCQTPYYFIYLENGKYNYKVIDFYLNYTKWLQEEFNFDGFRVDHIDHVVDEVSQKNDMPISYRIPARVLGKMNKQMKNAHPYFALLAEYMLWDKYYREYHKDMHFDLLWGNDIVCQFCKTPKQIIEDNRELAEYNKKEGGKNPLSILKAYNNQDGEFEAIDQYPGQMGEAGALFKWFKYKFLPGGKGANRPSLLVDGDESFTKTGVERIIGKEVSMVRNKSWFFFEKFDAINRFVENCPLILNGEAKLVVQEDDGFAVWKIEHKCSSQSLLVVTNYFAPIEKVEEKQKDGSCKRVIRKGHPVHNKTVVLDKDEKLVSYYEFDYDEKQKCVFAKKPLIDEIYCSITFNTLQPSEFKVYKVVRTK